MFGGGNESSQESIAFQDMIGEIEIDVSGQEEVSPWKKRKSTEEKLQLGMVKNAAITERQEVQNPSIKRNYMKSIEQKIPYNKIARQDKTFSKYLENDTSLRKVNMTKSSPQRIAKVTPPQLSQEDQLQQQLQQSALSRNMKEQLSSK